MNQEIASSVGLEGHDSGVLAVDELLERCMGNIEFAERVLSKFVNRFDEDLAELEKDLELEDSEGIVSVAHRLKGSSANVGAHGLRDRAAAIEAMARAQRTSEIRSGLDQLRDEWFRFVESASALAPSSESGNSD